MSRRSRPETRRGSRRLCFSYNLCHFSFLRIAKILWAREPDPAQNAKLLLISRIARFGLSSPTLTTRSCFPTIRLNRHIIGSKALLGFFPVSTPQISESLQIIISDISLAADAQHAKEERSKNHLQTKE